MKKLINANGYAPRDPYVIKHNGKYYRCFSSAADSGAVWVACADTIDGLSSAEGEVVYTPEPDREYSRNLWAPELHIIDDRCYIYVACDDGNSNNHRMFVLENGSNDPMKPYTMHGKIADETNKYAIDGTVMRHKGNLYFVWSGREGDVSGCQKLYIAKMESPYALASERIMISTPEFEWEKRGGTGKPGKSFINEGPFALVHDGVQYLFYSAAGSWCEDYCIAMLELVGEDPLDPKAWKKHGAPLFSSNELVKGAGHCSIVCENDQMHVFFHAWDRDEEEIKWGTVAAWHGEMKRKNGVFIIE